MKRVLDAGIDGRGASWPGSEEAGDRSTDQGRTPSVVTGDSSPVPQMISGSAVAQSTILPTDQSPATMGQALVLIGGAEGSVSLNSESKSNPRVVVRSLGGPDASTISDTTQAQPILQTPQTPQASSLSVTSGSAVSVPNVGLIYASVDQCRQAAEQGDAQAQAKLGLMYENGDGVQRDANLAVYWYRKAADLDNADAQISLAQMYDWGDGVEQDLEQAVYWYQRAADQGDTSAMIGLADVYLDNEDFHKDKEQGIYWLAKAADLGSPGAQCRLAIRHWTGDAVHQNFEPAAKWLRKAADQDNADAQIYLAQMHENGQGVEQDFKQAVYWYLRSKVHFTTSNDEVYSLSDKSDNLISCITEVLRDFREFDSCDTLNLNDFRFSEAGFAAIDQLIRFNRSLTCICISYLCIDNETHVTAMLRKLVESIRETIPTHRPPTLKFYDVNYPFLIQSIDHNKSIIDDPLRIQIDQLIELIEQNKAIYDLRLPLEKNPPVKSDELPLEVLKILADKLIVTSIRDGKTKEATQAAVDEFLMSAQYHQMLDSAVQVSRLPILPKNAAQ